MTEPDGVWAWKQGDVWWQHWTLATTTRTYDASTLLVQIRDATGALIATSESSPPSPVKSITTTGTDFTSTPKVFHWELASTSDLPIADNGYLIEAQCNVDGRLTTFFPAHPLTCLAQTAVPS